MLQPRDALDHGSCRDFPDPLHWRRWPDPWPFFSL